MDKKSIVILVAGLGLLGVAAFIFLKQQPEEKPDPVANILGAAPVALNAVGNIASSGIGTAKKIFGSIF